MIKAGLTDPTRPLGVFLFAGPTGTGKTEIAKVLTEFLFSRPERLVRIDMSELQSTEALARLYGGGGDRQRDRSLADCIREQPFSVVLLDEFEKAPPQVWNLFLQVFDDGRMTDHRGLAVNMRHTIIIMTSNLGGVVPVGSTLGFNRQEEEFRPETVRRAVEQTFPKEFLNRIDRTVIFRPLDQESMRAILRKELRAIGSLRGLRWRDWAIEWDDDALEFLLNKGFTRDLGARPLRRAIERYLLAPLGTVIANRQAPAGDQFLFVRTKGDRLDVEFVDPDAPEPGLSGAVEHAAEVVGPDAVPRLGQIVLDARGTRAEVHALELHHQRLLAGVQSESWQSRKRADLEQISERDFWERADRFEILGRVEYQDRIDRVLKSVGSLLERLTSSQDGRRERFPRKLMGELAQKLFLLDVAYRDVVESRPREAFLSLDCVQCDRVGGPSDAIGNAADGEPVGWGARVGSMYTAWARQRGMNCTVLEEAVGDREETYRLLLAIAGLGAHSLLAGETGLHVAEHPRQGAKGVDRERVRVTVVPQPIEPPEGATPEARLRALRRQAAAMLEAAGDSSLRVVRSYRMGGAPLVRDAVRGWRTGRLDQVMEGNFDLFGDLAGAPTPAPAPADEAWTAGVEETSDPRF